MQIDPYLNFPGNCEEAFKTYEKIFGGKIEFKMTHGESPMAAQVVRDGVTRLCTSRCRWATGDCWALTLRRSISRSRRDSMSPFLCKTRRKATAYSMRWRKKDR